MATNHRTDGIVLTIAVAILLIGTATGSAFLMLGMATSALAAVLFFYRQQIGSNVAIAASIAAAIAFAFGIASLIR